MKFKETTEEPQKETFVNAEIASVKKALEYKINLIQDTVNSIKESIEYLESLYDDIHD